MIQLILKRVIFLCAFIMGLTAQAASLLPSSLNGVTFSFHVANMKSPLNPNAGVTYTMNFKKNAYVYEAVNNKNKTVGHYSYQLLDKKNSVAIITCHEKYQGIQTDYTLLLQAMDERSGLYIYKQINGAIGPQERMNFASYTIIQN